MLWYVDDITEIRVSWSKQIRMSLIYQLWGRQTRAVVVDVVGIVAVSPLLLCFVYSQW